MKSSHSSNIVECSQQNQCFNYSMSFSIVGISHWKSDVSIRELFYLDERRKNKLSDLSNDIPGGVLTLDTCNRVELYGFCDPELLVKILSIATETDPEFLKEKGYIHNGDKAFNHLFRVGLGMDSQVPGDVQIIQQLKKAYQDVHTHTLSGEFHQLIQTVFRTHKRSRTETNFGRGNASVGFEATQQALTYFGNLSKIKVLLIGAGKMGKVSCKNLISNGARHISVINRSINKAEKLASSFDIKAYSFDRLQEQIEQANLIITATGSSNPILTTDHLKNTDSGKLIIDLSVPRNVSPDVSQLDHITLVDMDTITEANQEALIQRNDSIPQLEDIIAEEIRNYKDHVERSRYLLPRIKEIEQTLSDITDSELIKVKNKLDDDLFGELEIITSKIKKKLLAVHIERLDQELERSAHEV